MIEMMGVALILTEFLAYEENPFLLISPCVRAWVILLLHFEK